MNIGFEARCYLGCVLKIISHSSMLELVDEPDLFTLLCSASIYCCFKRVLKKPGECHCKILSEGELLAPSVVLN